MHAPTPTTVVHPTADNIISSPTASLAASSLSRLAGTLTTEQYLAIFAFDLTANGIKLDKPLDGPAAQAIVLHP